MRRSILTLIAAAAIAGVSPVWAHEFNLGALKVDHPRIPLPDAEASHAVGLLKIINETKDTEALTAVTSETHSVRLSHVIEQEGIQRAIDVDRLAVPSGKTIVFAEDGIHLRLELLEAPLKEGALILVKFHFERAGVMDVIFFVEDGAHQGH